MKIAEVIIDVPHTRVDRSFDYYIPAELVHEIQPGAYVRVPFKKGERKGFVITCKQTSKIKEIKKIKEVIKPNLLDSEQLFLVEWLRKNCLCFYITAIKAVLPAELIEGREKSITYVYKEKPGRPTELLSRAPRQLQAWQILQEFSAPPPLSVLCERAGVNRRIIKELARKGVVSLRNKPRSRMPQKLKAGKTLPPLSTGGQEGFYARLLRLLKAKKAKTVLWKTGPWEQTLKLYLHLISAALAEDRSVLLLVPEHQMAEQALEEINPYFPGQVALYHSAMAGTRRYSEWLRIKRGEAEVVVGTRSAVFAPVPALGLGIIHNEEDPSYQQQEHPQYQTQEILHARLARNNGLLLLVSANPSLQSFFRWPPVITPAEPDANAVQVSTVDMRKEFEAGNISMFSQSLQEKISSTDKDHCRTLLFINRRGYAPFMLCRSCGYVHKCPHCRMSLTLHKQRGGLLCHYCSHKEHPPKRCPECKSPFFRNFGVGTERVEEEVKKLFRHKATIIVDSDHIKKEDELLKAVQNSKEKPSVVIGTQLVLKEMFRPFQLVVALNIDFSLNLPHYGVAEECYQLLTYLQKMAYPAGEFLIQTYNPEHKIIKEAATHDYFSFARRELKFRKENKYPPYYHLLVYTLAYGNKGEGEGLAKKMVTILRSAADSEVEVIGPGSALFARLGGKYRWQIYCRCLQKESLFQLVERSRTGLQSLLKAGAGVNLAINPRRML